MQPVPFNPDSDLPPIPFDNDVCRLAEQLKRNGLPWVPHVGCFAWDPEHLIKPAAPFPDHIYFILSLPRFGRNSSGCRPGIKPASFAFGTALTPTPYKRLPILPKNCNHSTVCCATPLPNRRPFPGLAIRRERTPRTYTKPI